MSEAVTKWLVEDAPWLKYAVETQLLNLKSDVSLVVKDKSISVVINRLKDNQVGIPALKTGKVAYTRTGNAFWDLYFLTDIGLSAKDVKIEKEVEELFKLQLADGSLILMDGAKPGFHCIPTIILSSLAKMGYKDDPHIRKFLQNVFDLQRLDGGWHCALSRAKGKRLQDSDSCPMDNLNVLMLLGQYEEFRTDNRFNGAVDLLLRHWQKRKEPWRPYGFGIGGDFSKLRYPAVKYGILRVLDVLSMYPHAVRSKEFQDMLNSVLQKSKNGKYYAESVSRSYSEFDFGQTKEPSRWITFLVNRIQKRVNAGKTCK
jgi:hypothetical protein